MDEGIAARECEGAGQSHRGTRAEPDTRAARRCTCAVEGYGPVEDVRFQTLEFGTGVESELLDEHRSGAAESGQRVGLAARMVEGAGKQSPGRLAPRMLGDVGAQFGDEIGSRPGVEVDAGA